MPPVLRRAVHIMNRYLTRDKYAYKHVVQAHKHALTAERACCSVDVKSFTTNILFLLLLLLLLVLILLLLLLLLLLLHSTLFNLQ